MVIVFRFTVMHVMHVVRIMVLVKRWPVGRASNVFENCAALYPLPARSRWSLAEEGGLAPQLAKTVRRAVDVHHRQS